MSKTMGKTDLDGLHDSLMDVCAFVAALGIKLSFQLVEHVVHDLFHLENRKHNFAIELGSGLR